MKIIHYYPKNSQPFLSLSALSQSDALVTIDQFASKTELVYRRFKNPEKYLIDRKIAEDWLLQEFVKKGGKPTDKFPSYFVLGESPYVYEGYDKNCNTFEIDLNEIPDDQVSFTFPDSMVSRWLFEKHQQKEYFQKDYHGKLFTKSEIIDLVNTTGLPMHEWQINKDRKYDFFIEAQIWDKSLLII